MSPLDNPNSSNIEKTLMQIKHLTKKQKLIRPNRKPFAKKVHNLIVMQKAASNGDITASLDTDKIVEASPR